MFREIDNKSKFINKINHLKFYYRKFSLGYYLLGAIIACLVIQFVTGILMMTYYIPSVDEAYHSIQFLINNVPFGLTIRSLHYWSSNFLILSLILYIAGSFLFKEYRLSGSWLWSAFIILFILSLFAAFSGVVLPWDERAYLSLSIALSEIKELPVIGNFISDVLKGGNFISQFTLSRMFVLHSAILPLLFIFTTISILAALYFNTLKLSYKEENTEHINFYPDYLYKNIIYALILFIIILILSVIAPKFSGDYFDILNPSEPSVNLKPEWYFVFIYQLLKFDTYVPAYLISIMIFLFIVYLFMIPFIDKHLKRKYNLINISGFIILAVIVFLTIMGYLY